MMASIARLLCILYLLFRSPLCALSDEHIKTLYNSLDPTSVSQHLAFIELFGTSAMGQKAKDCITEILSMGKTQPLPPSFYELFLSNDSMNALVQLVNRPSDTPIGPLNRDLKEALDLLCQPLHHTSLKGHLVWSEEEMMQLKTEEIDLARGLFLSQLGENRPLIEAYEAIIDLMALQVMARLPQEATAEDKIKTINTLFFDEMGFRFPPHSIYAKNIDLYTFLPSVLDSKKGVCLGVSILYMCVAQRVNLPLEMITPPGHIFVRYREGEKIINIETTARGIHIDSEDYLTVNNKSLQTRSIKEVIGLAHFNQASIYWQNAEYEKALSAYKKAKNYMPQDPFLKELTGYIFLLTGSTEEGNKLIEEIKDTRSPYAIAPNTMAKDYINGKVDAKGISVIFKKTDEDRKSLLQKKDELEKTLQQYPEFRAGILTLATLWLELHRSKEALETLVKLSNDEDPEVHYYLAALFGERKDYPAAWRHLKRAERITKEHYYEPKVLKTLRRELLQRAAEP